MKYWQKIKKQIFFWHWPQFCFLPVCLCPYCPLWCAEISDFSKCYSSGLRKRLLILLGVYLCRVLKWEFLKMLFLLVILSLHMYYCRNVSASKWIIISLLYVSGFRPCRGTFACVESCSLQVTASTRINSLHTVSKAMTGPLMNLHSTTMKEVTTCHLVILKYVFLQPQFVSIYPTIAAMKYHLI